MKSTVMENTPIKFFHTFDEAVPEVEALSTSVLLMIAEDYGFKIESLNIVFTDDSGLLELNRTYLDHDWYTDVLTFPYSKDPKVIDGEIYCSLDRIREQALMYQANIYNEIYRIMIHGMLHLCGETDETDENRAQMIKLENHYLEKADVPRGTTNKN